MKLSDIFMICLTINAMRDVNAFRYIVFACAFICLVCRILQRVVDKKRAYR